MRCLTEREKIEILRSSSTDLLQSNSLSLRMTGLIDKSNKLRHPERSEGSFANDVWINPSPQSSPQGEEAFGGLCHAELIGNCPSPREEGVGERVQLEEKINPSLKIVSFEECIHADKFTIANCSTPHPSLQPYGTQFHTTQLCFVGSTCVPKEKELQINSLAPCGRGGFLKKCAFTLAEVLITLGVIGVVAAITIPGLMTSYQKHVVETKLAKFNATMNQAMRLSMADNGDPDDWVERGKSYSYDETVEFMNTYFLPYMKYIKAVPSNSQNGMAITLLDGSMFSFSIDGNGADIEYYVNGKNEINTRNLFQYQFTKRKADGTDDVNSSSYIEPYVFMWNGTVEHLKNGNTWACKKGCTNCGYCTKLIQLNGWKIPKDYPW